MEPPGSPRRDGQPRPRGQPDRVDAPAAKGQAQGPAGRDVRSGARRSPDQVTLSSQAEEFRRLRARLDQLPDPRGARVAELRALVAKGAYCVDGAKVADAMLDDPMTARLLGLGASA